MRWPVLAALAGGCLATPALACSPAPGYRVPGNYELVAKADLVVLARVVAGPSAENANEEAADRAAVVLEPVRAIKGTLPIEPLTVPGFVKDGEGKGFLAHPTPLSAVNPDALTGACVRYAYATGTLVVAVFHRSGMGYVRDSSPFARGVEDVEGLHGAWARAADSYAAISALPTDEARRAALKAEAARLLALTDDSAAPEIAADMLATADRL